MVKTRVCLKTKNCTIPYFLIKYKKQSILVATLDHTNNFTAEFNDLPKFKADGTTRIEYSVVEVNTMPGYTFSVATTNSDAPTVTSPDGTVSIVATNTRVTQEVKVNKKWVGVADSTAPSVNVELLDVTNPTSPISLGTKLWSYNANTAQNFTDVFTNLPKYKDDGVTEIHYEVKEVSPLPKYEVNVSAVTDVDASHKTATITNTYKTVDIHLTKSWVGVNAADAPAVTMQLVDATDANHKVDVAGKTVTLDANNGFAADLTDLPNIRVMEQREFSMRQERSMLCRVIPLQCSLHLTTHQCCQMHHLVQ